MNMKYFLTAILGLLLAIPASAVTEKEMEEARAITAQAYLRYANDGSGYLDEFKATSMSQLESKLKAKEKENIKAFKAVKVPSDYASWDKARLTEFWSVTFFTSPGLAEKGKAARSRVKQRISAMTVAAPSKAEETKEKAAETEPQPEAETPAEAATVTDASVEAPSAGEVIEKQEDILADQNAIAKDAEEKELRKDDGSTWIYVVVLIILVGIVVWLVVFAANMMKKQSAPLEKAAAKGGGDAELREQFAKAMAKKNDELSGVAATLEASERDNARLMDSLDKLKAENAHLRTENASLRSDVESLRSELAAAAYSAPAPRAPRAAAPQEAESPAQRMPNVIYLGRANRQGLFVRADRRITPGSSIFRLDTRDGLVGTFRVIDTPEVADLALSNPADYLSGGCTALDLDNTDGVSTIVTENAGTAIFEDGRWKVLRKSRIRYE